MSAAALALVSVLLAPAPEPWFPGSGRPLEEWFGYEGFGWLLLAKQKMTLIPRNERWDEGEVQGRLVVVMGEPSGIAGREKERLAFGQRLDRFVRAGGRLLVACDMTTANPILEPFGVRIEPMWRAPAVPAGGSIPPLPSTPPALAFRGFADCPLVVDLSAHPIMAGTGRVVTNRPAALSSSTLPILARFAPEIVARLPALPEGSRRGLVAAGPWGKGRVGIVSDHSMFINLMIAEEGNGRFAENLIAWLRPPVENARVLYYLQSVPQPPRGEPRVPAFLIAPQAAGDWERVNRVLSDPALGAGLNDLLRRNARPDRIARAPSAGPWIAALLALAGIFWMLRAHPRPPPFPRRLVAPVEAGPA